MRDIYLLGATGSIGTQVCDIIRAHPEVFNLVTATAHTNIKQLREVINQFHPEYVSVGTHEAKRELQELFPNQEIGVGETGLIKAATYEGSDGLLVNAVVGSAGLMPTYQAVLKGRDIALANKETLVIGGDIIMPLVREKRISLLPIDSEHSALMMCLKNEPKESVTSLIITASGGSFRDKTRAELTGVTVQDALLHPNWSMGAKITIDSATMMNKGFEIIEAHHLFDVPYNRIQAVLHQESIVHGLVEFNDGSMLAHMGHPDMRVPINIALFYPKRIPYQAQQLDLTTLKKLQFDRVSTKRYPLFKLAIEAGKTGGITPTILNAANEVAVMLFLNGKITFLQIEEIVLECLNKFKQTKSLTIEYILETDEVVKDYVHKQYS
ncbi:MAG: 1-deoxy-D-xylulose-5-phosphate reductoisomerase [Candidatus Izimaplasma sp.]|nr:1-deoxy-D-xylulose-5-phosphate reductoisomerase [Candidatus Izimaplasma bacterium]